MPITEIDWSEITFGTGNSLTNGFSPQLTMYIECVCVHVSMRGVCLSVCIHVVLIYEPSKEWHGTPSVRDDMSI